MKFYQLLPGMPDFAIEKVVSRTPPVFEVRWEGKNACPHCASDHLRIKDTFVRTIRNIPISNKRSRFHMMRLVDQHFSDLCKALDEKRLAHGRGRLMRIMLTRPDRLRSEQRERALYGMLPLAGLKVRQADDVSQTGVSLREAFPDASPAMALRLGEIFNIANKVFL